MDPISEVLIAILIILMALITIAVFIIFKHAEYLFIFTTNRTITGHWLLFKQKVKDGKIRIGDQEYLIGKTKPFLLRHKLLGHLPAYFYKENNPEPMDLSAKFPKSKLTARAVKEMGEMAAIEKIMAPDKKPIYDIFVYLAIGVFIGVGLTFMLLFTGVIEIPVGLCLSNPQVVDAAINMTYGGPLP